MRSINWRIFAILLFAGLVGVLAVLPYTFDLIKGGTLAQRGPELSLPLIIVLALLQNGILLAVFIAIGMTLSARVGFEMPLLRAWANGEHSPNLKAIVTSGFFIGAAAGTVLVGLDALFFVRHLPPAMLPMFDIPLWKRLLAGVVYGGITEELIMRLFLLSLTVWLLAKLFRTPPVWASIVLIAVVFGLGHLPITAAITRLTPLLVVRAVVLNGVAGIAFGYLYWRRGLEAAMLGHMSAHVVMQVPGVILLKNLL